MTYLLDTMIVSYFLQAERGSALAAAARCCAMVVVDHVKRELGNDRRRGDAFKNWFETSGIQLRAIELGTPAHATLAALTSRAPGGKDLGEYASIALATEDPSLTFVTHDKNGAFVALQECWRRGEHPISLAVFLRRLFEQRALDDARVVDDVMKIAITSPRLWPTWWASWFAGISTPGGIPEA